MSSPATLQTRYLEALTGFLNGDERAGDNAEAALLLGYDCGRQALADEKSLLDLLAMHQQALLGAGLRAFVDEDGIRFLAGGQAVLSQTLVPFEVARRGFAESNIALRDLNAVLEQRVAELRTSELQLRRQAAHLQSLADASGVFAEAAPDYERLLDAIARATAEATGDGCTVRLVAEDGTTLRRVAAHHPDPALRDALWDDRLPAISDVLTAPLLARGRLIGQISLLRFQPGVRFDPEDESFLRGLAVQAALVVDNARLHRDTQAALSREQAARAETEAALHQRDEFLSVAAHELKTPIASVQAHAELLLRRHARNDADPVQLTQALARIAEQSRKLGRLSSQLLDTVRIDADRFHIERRSTNITALAQSVLEAAQARTTNHALVLLPVDSVVADVDALRIEQVLTNLVDNAIKYSPDGGAIEVDISEWDDGTLRLAVRDHGLGIPPDRRSQLFSRFFRAHDARHASGLGLGLYISRQIIERHGGQIEAEFPSDGGLCVHVRIPR